MYCVAEAFPELWVAGNGHGCWLFLLLFLSFGFGILGELRIFPSNDGGLGRRRLDLKSVSTSFGLLMKKMSCCVLM
jgi:hypothetical protein